MKKALLLAVAASTLILTGCSWTTTKTDDAMMKKDDVMMKQEPMETGEKMIQDNDKMMMWSGMSGQRTQEEMEKMKKDDMMKDETMMMKDDKMMMKAGAYEDYNASTVSAAVKSGKRVALFFHASRCPGCRSLDTDIKAWLSTLPANSIVFKVNYDTMTDLKKQYGVTSQHTVVALNTDMSMKSKTIGTSLADVVKQLQ
jgi:thioredoxin 1